MDYKFVIKLKNGHEVFETNNYAEIQSHVLRNDCLAIYTLPVGPEELIFLSGLCKEKNMDLLHVCCACDFVEHVLFFIGTIKTRPNGYDSCAFSSVPNIMMIT